jgi:ferrochelatase
MFKKTKVVIGQLGSPESTQTKDVRKYLKEFLGDPRVVDLPRVFWWLILNLFVLPFRPKKSAQAYSRIWDGQSFPLIENTKKFAHKVEQHLDKNIELNYAFLLSEPRVSTLFKHWEQEDEVERADRLIVLPQFPQYSESTSASVVDTVAKTFSKAVNIPDFEFVSSYHRLKSFIDLSVAKIQKSIDENHPEELIISFHGIPLRRVLQKKDQYYLHCYETYHLIREKLNFPKDKVHFTFQSRFGSEQWLGPATDEYAVELIENGAKSIATYSPSFVVDCLETTDELGHELTEEIEEAGGKHYFIECLNDDDDWAKGYAEFINTYVNGKRTELKELFYLPDRNEMKKQLPEQKQKSPPLDDKAKKNIKLVFLTLFLDLIGFSIIFPLFPALAKHYLTVDSDNFFLKLIFSSINALTDVGGTTISGIVLFGGALGALYSLLQFIAAPIWGSISDRVGRRPVLLLSIFGLFLSYVLWIFAGSFSVLILARIIGGIMGGNLSVATAVVADVTQENNRSKGMAFVGIAFAFGFIFGPALGGICSLLDLSAVYPSLIKYGINPFSTPALLAAALSLINLIFIASRFEETLPQDKRKVVTNKRVINPFKLLKPLPYENVNLTNYSYFIYITAFSGMEFTLTFLALERLSYSSMDNAYMFIFIGLLIAFTQGGYVRRKAHDVGEKKMAIQGMISVIPGLLIIAFANSSALLYLGLFFLAVGSAMTIPTLTSLVSLYTPAQEQGHSLGIFRSLGSLGRVFGPAIASIIYWKWGSHIPYVLGAISLIIPIVVLSRIKLSKEA